jgi:cytochrome c oxidase subunit 2
MNAFASVFLLADAGASFWLPPEASAHAAETDWLFWLIFYLCTFFFVLIIVTAAVFCWKYRRRTPDQAPLPSPEHNTPIEVFWTIVPLLLVIYIFYVGFSDFMKIETPPANAYTIDVTGQKWAWSFAYPDGATPDDGKLHVPAGEPVKLLMTSQDVLHSFFIPAFRVKQDLVPGRYTTLWFEALQPPDGAETCEYHLTCAEYCGFGHSAMFTKVVVHKDRASFDKWLGSQGKYEPDIKHGETIYNRLCISCHSLDETVKQAPGWGHVAKLLKDHLEEQLVDGAATVDEEYIRESIMEPAAKVVTGFQPIMPTFKGQLKDSDIKSVILYIKSLAQ